jgi:hypothetical protein
VAKNINQKMREMKMRMPRSRREREEVGGQPWDNAELSHWPGRLTPRQVPILILLPMNFSDPPPLLPKCPDMR